MDVVTVLQKAPRWGTATVGPVPARGRLALWVLALLDVMTVAWMLSMGDWFDRFSSVTAVVTLGGHHQVVLWLAVAGFATLAVLTVLTGALAVVRRIHVAFLVLGALISLVAVAGVASVLLLVGLLAVVGGMLIGGRFVFLSGLFRGGRDRP